MNFDQAKLTRDRRLRRLLLVALHNARHSPRGELGAQTLADVVDSAVAPDQRFEDEDHALRLMRDLVNKTLASEKILPRRRTERFGLRHVTLRITAKGSSLINETIPPDPDIDDERIVEDA